MTQLNAVGRATRKIPTSSAPLLRVVTPAPSPAPRAPSTAGPQVAQPVLAPVPAESPAARIRALFEDTLPRLIPQRADLFDRVRGSLSVFVEGAGAWCVTFGDHRRADAIAPTASFETDAVVVFTVAQFAALLDGEPGVAPMVALGDTKLLSRLGQLMLEPARGALGVRLSTPTSPRR